jgi:hypothetical protein
LLFNLDSFAILYDHLPYSKEVRYPAERRYRCMLAKKTSKNQVTLPKKILKEIPETDYFDVSLREGNVVLRPVTIGEHQSRLTTVREKIRDLGITSTDIDKAIQWARGRRKRQG